MRNPGVAQFPLKLFCVSYVNHCHLCQTCISEDLSKKGKQILCQINRLLFMDRYENLEILEIVWNFFCIYLNLKTTHGWFLYLLQSEKNTWMFSVHLLKSEDNTWMFFSIYLSLKTTHECFLSIYLSLKITDGCIFFHLL